MVAKIAEIFVTNHYSLLVITKMATDVPIFTKSQKGGEVLNLGGFDYLKSQLEEIKIVLEM